MEMSSLEGQWTVPPYHLIAQPSPFFYKLPIMTMEVIV
jgi:hypothetical protein